MEQASNKFLNIFITEITKRTYEYEHIEKGELSHSHSPRDNFAVLMILVKSPVHLANGF